MSANDKLAATFHPDQPLCDFCRARLTRAAEHGHVDEEWAARAARDLAKQCCGRKPD